MAGGSRSGFAAWGVRAAGSPEGGGRKAFRGEGLLAVRSSPFYGRKEVDRGTLLVDFARTRRIAASGWRDSLLDHRYG